MNIQRASERNFFKLQKNVYPGRGIVVGLDEDGENLVQVYWIMGRSENSRNRVFLNDGGRLYTEAADPSKVKDPSLIIYNAMREADRRFVVSNGRQTDAVLKELRAGGSMYQTLLHSTYEPDAPNFTPRITAQCSLVGPCLFEMAILRKSRFDDVCERQFFCYEKVPKGIGMCFTTYLGEGDPLPSYRGEPHALPLLGDIENIAEMYWTALDAENKVSLAVKFINQKSEASALSIRNKYKKT